MNLLVAAAVALLLAELVFRVREYLIDFMQREYPQYLPRQRADVTMTSTEATSQAP